MMLNIWHDANINYLHLDYLEVKQYYKWLIQFNIIVLVKYNAKAKEISTKSILINLLLAKLKLFIFCSLLNSILQVNLTYNISN